MNRFSADIDMRRYFIAVMAALFMLSLFRADAQRFSISTNLLDYACLGTFNSEFSYSVSRYWSITCGAEYNPFTYRKGQENQLQLRQRSLSIGARIWPWHTWSGWWMAGKIRYQEYNYGGIISRQTEEGDRAGVGLYAGYTYMVSPRFNLEFGLGGWTGLDRYSRYSCQQCGLTEKAGHRWFILPDDIMIALVYVF